MEPVSRSWIDRELEGYWKEWKAAEENQHQEETEEDVEMQAAIEGGP
jgi:hypothetical protein